MFLSGSQFRISYNSIKKTQPLSMSPCKFFFSFFHNGERKMPTWGALTKSIDMNWVLFETNITSRERARNR